MPSLERLRSGYRIKWREGGRGSKEHTTPVIASKPEAAAALARITAELAARKPLRRGIALPLEQVLQRWRIAKLSGDEPNDEWTTDDAIRRARKHFTAMGWTTTEGITPAEVQRWRDTTANTRRAGAIIRAILWWAKDYAEQWVDDRTLAALRPQKGKWKRKERELPPVAAVVQAYYTACAISENLGALVHVASLYAWRPITLAKLDVRDIQGDIANAKVKGARIVPVPLMPQTVEMLARISQGRKPEDPLFTDPRTGERWALHYSRAISQYCRDNLGIHVYDLKYFAASNLLALLPPHRAKRISTHLTTGQLVGYGRSNMDDARSAIASVMAASNATLLGGKERLKTDPLTGAPCSTERDEAGQTARPIAKNPGKTGT
jgi:hypothetical protein